MVGSVFLVVFFLLAEEWLRGFMVFWYKEVMWEDITISGCHARWCGHLVLVARAWDVSDWFVCHIVSVTRSDIYLDTNLSIVFCMNSVKFQVGIFKFIQVIEESLCFYLSMVTRCFVSICRWCKRRYVSGSACSLLDSYLYGYGFRCVKSISPCHDGSV